ncbi:hypothetical protein BCR44DRAFT_43961 [Catenaria anguillulae PL171]|uniref:Uncharacterized protein n=1 Tax=Catenaria anguillulae PL171 TaxID=765915 RepID=A0A1Y2HTK3_9FUNG|nr:hypothetical protein BCR44DRAFT_43961 [Catenaria anguillulae PL171]
MKEECNDWRSAPPIRTHHQPIRTDDTNVPRETGPLLIKRHGQSSNSLFNRASHPRLSMRRRSTLPPNHNSPLLGDRSFAYTKSVCSRPHLLLRAKGRSSWDCRAFWHTSLLRQPFAYAAEVYVLLICHYDSPSNQSLTHASNDTPLLDTQIQTQITAKTGLDIAQLLKDVLDSFDVGLNKVIALTMDNASANPTALSNLNKTLRNSGYVKRPALWCNLPLSSYACC